MLGSSAAIVATSGTEKPWYMPVVCAHVQSTAACDDKYLQHMPHLFTGV